MVLLGQGLQIQHQESSVKNGQATMVHYPLNTVFKNITLFTQFTLNT